MSRIAATCAIWGASRPPSQVRIVNIREQTKIGDYMVVDNAAGLIALAQRNTAVCAYSARSRAAVPVSVPIAWDELSTRLRPQRWTVRTVPKRVRDSPDAWGDYFETRQHLKL